MGVAWKVQLFAKIAANLCSLSSKLGFIDDTHARSYNKLCVLMQDRLNPE